MTNWKLRGVLMIGKIAVTILVLLGLVACGSSSDSDEGQYLELEQYKGEAQEPTLIEVDENNGSDSVEINSLITGNIDRFHSILFQYTALQEGEIALILNSSSDEINFSVNSGDVEQRSFAFTGNNAVVLSVVMGGFYEIRLTSTEDNKSPFQFKIVEANRSSLGLSDSEYWINSKVTDSALCGENENISTYIIGQIFNFEKGYLSYSDDFKIADFKLNSEMNFDYIESYNYVDFNSDDEVSYSYDYGMELITATGEVVGAFNSAFGDSECVGTSIYEGKTFL